MVEGFLTRSASLFVVAMVALVISRNASAQTCAGAPSNVLACSGQSFTSGTGVGIDFFAGVYGQFGNGQEPGAGVLGQADDDDNYGVEGYNGPGIGVYGVTNDGTAAVFGTTAYTYGVEGQATNTDGTGVFGTTSSSGGYGVQASNTASGGTGIYATATGTNSTGIWGAASGSDAYAVYGQLTSGAGYGIYGTGGSTGTGVYGTTSDGDAYGVVGYNTHASGENDIGVYGVSDHGWAAWFTGGPVNITVGLQVDGTCEFGSCSVSDRRLKRDIKPVVGALDRLLKLKPVSFDWIEPEKRGENERGRQEGFIAQDVAPFFPDWVRENKDGYETLNIPEKQMAALSVEAFRQLKTENDGLRLDVDVLKKQVQALANGERPDVGAPRFNPNNLAWVGLGVLGTYIAMNRRKKQAQA